MTKKSCIISFFIIFAAVLISLPFVIYLKVLPYAVSNEKVIAFVSEAVKESTGAELVIENPERKLQNLLHRGCFLGFMSCLLQKIKSRCLV